MKPVPEAPETSVGCKYCVVGHVPTWNPTPLPGEYVHVIQEKTATRTTTVTVVSCVAFNKATTRG